MAYEPLINQNPLRALKMGTESTKHIGLVMARAGLGKTALLVQIALDYILRGNRVVHVTIGETIEKTKTWYDDILQCILREHRVAEPQELIDLVKHHRMIMTFKESAFSRPKLEERLNDLILQDIFRPTCLVVDGFDFETTNIESLNDINELLETMNLHAWFSAVCHRNDRRKSALGVPAPCHELEGLFDTVILLQPEDDNIKLAILKNSDAKNPAVSLNLDPTTMMIQKRLVEVGSR